MRDIDAVEGFEPAEVDLASLRALKLLGTEWTRQEEVRAVKLQQRLGTVHPRVDRLALALADQACRKPPVRGLLALSFCLGASAGATGARLLLSVGDVPLEGAAGAAVAFGLVCGIVGVCVAQAQHHWFGGR